MTYLGLETQPSGSKDGSVKVLGRRAPQRDLCESTYRASECPYVRVPVTCVYSHVSLCVRTCMVCTYTCVYVHPTCSRVRGVCICLRVSVSVCAGVHVPDTHVHTCIATCIDVHVHIHIWSVCARVTCTDTYRTFTRVQCTYVHTVYTRLLVCTCVRQCVSVHLCCVYTRVVCTRGTGPGCEDKDGSLGKPRDTTSRTHTPRLVETYVFVRKIVTWSINEDNDFLLRLTVDDSPYLYFHEDSTSKSGTAPQLQTRLIKVQKGPTLTVSYIPGKRLLDWTHDRRGEERTRTSISFYLRRRKGRQSVRLHCQLCSSNFFLSAYRCNVSSPPAHSSPSWRHRPASVMTQQ